MSLIFFFFFFSSRRRHTRLVGDWSQTCALPIFAKPFELKELSARIAALLRRLTPRDEVVILEVGGLTLNSKPLQVSTPHAASIQLTSTEFKLLHHLMSAPNQVHSVRDLLDGVWKYPDGSGDPDLVRAHIRNLRAKIERDPRSPEFVKTIHGIGYLIRSEEHTSELQSPT